MDKFLLWISILSLLACSDDKKEVARDKDKSHTFQVGKVNADFINPSAILGWGDFYSNSDIGAVACIKNNTGRVPIMRDYFRINGPDGSVERESDDNGCIHWGISKSFVFLHDAKDLSYPIEVEGIGRHKGTERIDLLINPWSGEKSLALKDLRFVDATTGINIASKTVQNPAISPLALGNLGVREVTISRKKIVSTSGQVEVTYEVRLTANYRRRDISGALIERDFTEGSFILDMFMVEEPLRQGEYLLIDRVSQTVHINNGKINTTVKFTIPPLQMAYNDPILKIFFGLTPIDGPEGLSDFSLLPPWKILARAMSIKFPP